MKRFDGNKLVVDVPKKPKKITGTRLASILGFDKWNTEFKTWCEITRTYEEPFTDNIYTIAGKKIEPKIISYLNRFYFLDSVKSPRDVLPHELFECYPNTKTPKHRGDFFPDNPIFGGMWDALVYGDDGQPETVIEIKTSKRVEDWADGKAPVYYALQASLYATLIGIDSVCMVAAFLDESDYEHPENFVPNVSNTITDCFEVSERFPDMKKLMAVAKHWWNDHVLTGVSPAFDEKKDADILKALRTNTVDADADIEALLTEAEALQDEIDDLTAKYLAEKEARLAVVKDMIKQYGIQQFRPEDKKVEFRTTRFVWSIGKSVTQTVDKAALKKDGLLDRYSKSTETYKLNPPKQIQEEKSHEV